MGEDRHQRIVGRLGRDVVDLFAAQLRPRGQLAELEARRA